MKTLADPGGKSHTMLGETSHPVNEPAAGQTEQIRSSQLSLTRCWGKALTWVLLEVVTGCDLQEELFGWTGLTGVSLHMSWITTTFFSAYVSFSRSCDERSVVKSMHSCITQPWRQLSRQHGVRSIMRQTEYLTAARESHGSHNAPSEMFSHVRNVKLPSNSPHVVLFLSMSAPPSPPTPIQACSLFGA